MDWLQFISAMTGHLAWPVAGVVIAFLFREQVRKLLDKMKTFKGPGGIEASFTEDAHKVAAQAKQVQLFSITRADQDHIAVDNLNRILMERPAAIILDAWRNIEKAMLDVIADRGLYVSERDANNVSAWIAALQKEGLLTLDHLGIVSELRKLRNSVAHVKFEPDTTAAMDYLESAQRVVSYLKSLLRSQDPYPKGD